MNRKHFCLQETQKNNVIVCWNSKHMKETHNCEIKEFKAQDVEQDVLEKGKGKIDTKIKAS